MKIHEEHSLTAAVFRLARDLWKHPLDLVALLVACGYTFWALLIDFANEGRSGYLIGGVLLIALISTVWVQVRISPLLTSLAAKAQREELALTFIQPVDYLKRQLKWPMIRLFAPAVICCSFGSTVFSFMQCITAVINSSPDYGYSFRDLFLLLCLYLTLIAAFATLIIGLIAGIFARLHHACCDFSNNDLHFYFNILKACLAPLLQVIGVYIIYYVLFRFLFVPYSMYIIVVIILPIAMSLLALFNWFATKRHWKKLCAAYYEFE